MYVHLRRIPLPPPYELDIRGGGGGRGRGEVFIFKGKPSFLTQNNNKKNKIEV